MRIGASLLLIAIGAVLKFGVTTHVNGISIGVIGVILMIVGAIGLLITCAAVDPTPHRRHLRTQRGQLLRAGKPTR